MTDARGRTDRQTEERTERRRRKDTTIDGGQRLKLAIPPEVEERLKAEGRTPRWINDQGNRIHNLTQLDDYDPVDGVTPVHVGFDKDTGKPVKAILHSKPTAFIEEDKAKLEARRRETEKALQRKAPPGNSDAEGFYVADGTSIDPRGRRSA